MMKEATPKTIYLKEYTPPPYWINNVDLLFELGEESELNLFTWQLGDLVLTEITPLDEPRLLGFFE